MDIIRYQVGKSERKYSSSSFNINKIYKFWFNTMGVFKNFNLTDNIEIEISESQSRFYDLEIHVFKNDNNQLNGIKWTILLFVIETDIGR